MTKQNIAKKNLKEFLKAPEIEVKKIIASKKLTVVEALTRCDGICLDYGIGRYRASDLYGVSWKSEGLPQKYELSHTIYQIENPDLLRWIEEKMPHMQKFENLIHLLAQNRVWAVDNYFFGNAIPLENMQHIRSLPYGIHMNMDCCCFQGFRPFIDAGQKGTRVSPRYFEKAFERLAFLSGEEESRKWVVRDTT